jgi:hypothetical protein
MVEGGQIHSIHAFLVIAVFFLERFLLVSLRLDSTDWPGTHDPSALVSQMLELQA